MPGKINKKLQLSSNEVSPLNKSTPAPSFDQNTRVSSTTSEASNNASNSLSGFPTNTSSNNIRSHNHTIGISLEVAEKSSNPSSRSESEASNSTSSTSSTSAKKASTDNNTETQKNNNIIQPPTESLKHSGSSNLPTYPQISYHNEAKKTSPSLEMTELSHSSKPISATEQLQRVLSSLPDPTTHSISNEERSRLYRLITEGADLNVQSNTSGYTLLMYAALPYDDQTTVSEILIGIPKDTTDSLHNFVMTNLDKFDINLESNTGVTALALAYYFKNYPLAHALLNDPRIRIHSHPKKGVIILMIAIERKDYNLVSRLCEKQYPIDLNTQNVTGNTPLTLAISQTDDRMVSISLQQKEINVNKENAHGISPLIAAASSKQIDANNWLITRGKESIIAILCRHPHIAINQQTSELQRNALMIAADRGRTNNIMQLLQFSQTLINEQDKNGYTALMCAISSDQTHSAIKLLEHPNVDINIESYQQKCALTIAIERENIRIIEAIITHKNSPILDKIDALGNNCLMLATEIGNLTIVKFLLSYLPIDYPFTAKNNRGLSALDLAKKGRHLDIIKELIQIPSLLLEIEERDCEFINLSTDRLPFYHKK